MGTYYAWFCDAKRQYFDPGELPYFGDKYGAIPWTGWAVAVLALTEWSGESVRLIGDDGGWGDEYYTLTDDGEYATRDRGGAPPYVEVSALALRRALDLDAVPDDAIRLMARDLLGEVRAQGEPIAVVRGSLRLRYPPAW